MPTTTAATCCARPSTRPGRRIPARAVRRSRPPVPWSHPRAAPSPEAAPADRPARDALQRPGDLGLERAAVAALIERHVRPLVVADVELLRARDLLLLVE